MHGKVDNEGYLYRLFNAPSTIEELSIQIEIIQKKDIIGYLSN